MYLLLISDSELFFNQLDSYRNLETLIIDNCKFNEVTDKIGNLKKLEKLVFYATPINKVSDEIKNLKNLK